MGLEPHVLLGIWSNGSTVCRVYKTSQGSYEIIRNANLPAKGDSLLKSEPSKIKWKDLVNPTTSDLKKHSYDCLMLLYLKIVKAQEETINSIICVILF